MISINFTGEIATMDSKSFGWCSKKVASERRSTLLRSPRKNGKRPDIQPCLYIVVMICSVGIPALPCHTPIQSKLGHPTLCAQATGDPTWEMGAAFQGKGVLGIKDRVQSSQNAEMKNPDSAKYSQAIATCHHDSKHGFPSVSFRTI